MKLEPAPRLAPSERTYRGAITTPERWSVWTPARGDILVCTPPKCGTTWTQTILAMLVNGGAQLTQKLPVLSPWVDADLGVPADEVAAALDAQTMRRVVKTHTPADGFPVWDGVQVIAVYRHPLDVFFSLRKHIANVRGIEDDHPMLLPVGRSLRLFLDGSTDADDLDRDVLATFTTHFSKTVQSGRLPDLKLFHYADMLRDGQQAVAALAQAAGIKPGPGLIDAVAKATAFSAMKNKAKDFAPVGGTGFWKSDAGFFDAASSNKWEGQLSDTEFGLYRARLAELIPDERARHWLENGGAF